MWGTQETISIWSASLEGSGKKNDRKQDDSFIILSVLSR